MKMYIIKENSQFKRVIDSLDHTKAETAEKCFWNFADDVIETTLDDLQNRFKIHCEENEDYSMTFEQHCDKCFDVSPKTLQSKRLFEVWDGTGCTKIYGYNNEPDWNEMLNYRYGDVCSPRAREAKYFIEETTD